MISNTLPVSARRAAHPLALAMGLVAGFGHVAALAAEPKAASTGIEQVTVVGKDLAQRTTAVGKIDVPLVETPFSVSILTEDFFTATGVKTLQDALQYSAGVNGGTYGIDSRGDWSTIRGTAPVQYIDGLKSLFGNYNNTRAVPYTLERVEILKGPSSVLYGQGSLGGVVNLSSKLPEQEFAAQVWAQYGTFERKQLAADVTGALDADGEWLFRVVALGRDSETQTDYVNDDSRVFSPSLTWKPSEATSITLLANIQKDETGTGTQFLPWQGTVLPGAFGDIDPGVFLSEPGWDKYNSEQEAFTLLATQALNDSWTLNARVRHTDSSADYWSMWPVFTGSGLRINADGRTINRAAYVSDASSEVLVGDVNLQGSFSTGFIDHKLVVGVDAQDATIDNDFWRSNGSYAAPGAGGSIDLYNPVYGQYLPTPNITNYPYTQLEQEGFYIQDHMTAGNWVLTAALRRDQVKSQNQNAANVNYDTDADTGRVGVMYQFANGLRPYASYTESFEPMAGFNVYDEALKPKTGEQTELGVKYQPGSSNLLVTFALFEINENGRTVSVSVPQPDNTFKQGTVQTGEAKSEGAELEVQGSWAQWDLIASYSYTDTKDKVTGYRFAAIPENLASFWGSYRFTGDLQGLRVGLGVRDIGKSWDGRDNRNIRIDGYTLVDAMLGYELENWFFSLNARNLEDKIHYTSCLARGDCFAGERRTITADVRYNF